MSKDYSYVEASSGGDVDHQGWPKKPPVSDRECIYRCLENCQELAGLDRKQVSRLMDDFKTKKTKFVRNEEYPVL